MSDKRRHKRYEHVMLPKELRVCKITVKPDIDVVADILDANIGGMKLFIPTQIMHLKKGDNISFLTINSSLKLSGKVIYTIPWYQSAFFIGIQLEDKEDYKKYVEDMTTAMTVSDDVSFYVQNASITDPSLAPEGKSTLYVLVPVPNNKSNIDWDDKASGFRNRILDLLEKNHWNKTKVAKILGIGRTTLWRKLRQYGIAPSL